MQDLSDKVVFLTGAGGTIGRAIAVQFARANATLVLTDIARAAGEATTLAARELGASAEFVELDIRVAADVTRAFRAVMDRYGRLDVGINNAAVIPGGVPFTQVSEEQFSNTFATNVTGTWLCMKEQLKVMLAQRSGAVVNVASIAGLQGARDLSDYVASKHAVVGLTRAAAAEVASLGVRVNALCPGFVNSPVLTGLEPKVARHLLLSIPSKRFAEPDEVASAALWLSSSASSYVNGHALSLDGGVTSV